MIKSIAVSRQIRKKAPVVIPLGIGLNDEREECFCLLIADGLPLAIAFKTAGFTAKHKSHGALHLYGQQRIQDRVKAILRARASHPPVSLSEVTDMLKRVYAGALHSNEFTPAHNAAFSLARLYGLVVDRAQLDVIRRPSREPDAPAERALSSWIAELPPYTPGPQGPPGPSPVSRETLGSGLLIEATASGSDFATTRQDLEARGQTGKGPHRAGITGTPAPRAHSVPSGHSTVDPTVGVRSSQKDGSPLQVEGTGPDGGPSIEDLF